MTDTSTTKLGVGLYGTNGHQIQSLLVNHPEACWVASSMIPNLPESVMDYMSLDAMLADDRVQLVSLCSPIRAEQAEHAIRCMRAGKHVYAEKPCALTESELDRLISVSRETGCVFHEMAGTAFEEPYLSMGKIVRGGLLGEIVQVFVQKSYPYHNARPQDEAVDGGLLLQVGIHAARLIEHTAGCRIRQAFVVETKRGNPIPAGELRMAVSVTMTLENGGVASVAANYLNQRGHGQWGNDHLRIFGTLGFVESTDGGNHTRLVIGDKDMGAIAYGDSAPTYPTYFDMIVSSILRGTTMPLTMEAELHPLRVLLNASSC